METASWQLAATAFAGGVAGGLLFWALARLGSLAAGVWRARLPFAADVLAAAGNRERRSHHHAGRELAALLGGVLCALLIGIFAWFLLPYLALPAVPSWAVVVVAVLAVAVVAAAAWQGIRLLKKRRQLRFRWAAKAAIGNILKRLNFAGNRVFNEVALEGAVLDFVVVGAKGVFAVNVVARPLPSGAEGRPAAELKNGKLSLGGTVEALPVGDAARNMTLLTAALTRVVGHRVPVRSVLAVPGWHSVPSGEGNHLLLNDGNLAMLTSWNKPDAYLMDEDCIAIQKFLQETTRVRGID